MLDVVTIAGCPSPISRSTAILHYVNQTLATAHLRTETILIRQLPAQDLCLRQHSPVIQQQGELVKQATNLILGTPIHKGAYSEGLQAFLELLPRHALINKVVLPITIGQQEDDFFAVDAGLRALVATLGASQVLEGIYIQEQDVHLHNRQVYIDDPAKGRLDRGIKPLLRIRTEQLRTYEQYGSAQTFVPSRQPTRTQCSALWPVA